MTNTLFTSAGRRVELVRAFRRAYADLGLSGNVVAADIDPLAPALHHADRAYVVPRLSDPGYVGALVDICRRESVRLIFPLIDPDVRVLARHRKELEATGAVVGVPSKEGVETVSDKWLTYGLFRRLDVPTPRTWLPAEVRETAIDYPVLVKPRLGSAGQDVFVARTARELDFFLDYVPDPVVQEYLPGPEITTDVICDLDGAVLGVASRQRLETRGGEVTKGVTVCDARIVDHCVTIARALRAVGPITVQCMLRDERPYFTEVNARFGGGVPLAIAAGLDAPRWLLARAAGQRIDAPPLGVYRTSLYLTRFDESLFLTPADVASVHGPGRQGD